MAERRSLSNAISNPVPGVDADLVRSFVTQNQAAERPVADLPVSVEPSRTRVAESTPIQDAGPAKPVRPKPKKPNRFQPVGLIPVTVRLRPEIARSERRWNVSLRVRRCLPSSQLSRKHWSPGWPVKASLISQLG